MSEIQRNKPKAKPRSDKSASGKFKSGPGGTRTGGAARRKGQSAARSGDRTLNRFPKVASTGKQTSSTARSGERRAQEQGDAHGSYATKSRQNDRSSFRGSRTERMKRSDQRRPQGKGLDKGAPQERRRRPETRATDQVKTVGYERQASVHRPMDEIMQEYIEQLVKARSDERMRIARKMALHERYAISAVDRLLNSRDRHLRLAAAMVLSYVKSAQAVPALAHALGDTEATVRLQAAAGLGKHRHPAAREALWYAFPDKSPGVSIAILRAMENIMTDDMADALRAMDTDKMSPRVQAELKQILSRRPTSKQSVPEQPKPDMLHSEGTSPLSTAPWLRMPIGERCTGFAVPGTEEIAAALLQWRLDSVDIERIEAGAIRFSTSKQMLPQLVEARAFDSIWVNLPRAARTELTADTELFNSIYAFAHAKGMQSAIISGEISGSSARALARALGLRSTRPPGNPRTLRMHVTPKEVSVEFIAAADFPLLHSSVDSSAARALVACLCALTVGGPIDVLLDPFCGEGQVLIERALLGPMGKAIGADQQEETVDRARRAWRIMAPLSTYAGDAAFFTTWDEQLRLELDTHSVDAVATTLNAEALDDVLPAHMQELARILKPNRKAAFLVADNRQLHQLLALSGWTTHQEIVVGEPQVGYLIVAGKD